MNEMTPIQPEPRSVASCAQSMVAAELAKMLALVAPVTMSSDQQTAWLAAAIDALEGIRPDEVAHISLEVRRTVTRPSQIVPEIANLVAARRNENCNRHCDWDWDMPLIEAPKKPEPEPLTAAEIAAMPAWLQSMGLRVGFLKRANGALVDNA